MKNNTFYVGFENPIQFRREILLCTKDMLTALKTYEKYKRIREEKRAKINEFRILFKEINTLNNKLKKTFPKKKIQAAMKSIQKPKKVETVSKEKKKSRLSVIQEQLDVIESQIKGLS